LAADRAKTDNLTETHSVDHIYTMSDFPLSDPNRLETAHMLLSACDTRSFDERLRRCSDIGGPSPTVSMLVVNGDARLEAR